MDVCVILEGDMIVDVVVYVKENYVVKGEMFKYINGFDDFEIIFGVGLVGIEMFEDVCDVDVVVIFVGGGGLIVGIVFVVKYFKSGC